MMDAIEHNNRERLKAFANAPASEMSIRDKIAADAMSSLIKTMNIHSEANLDKVADIAAKMADEMIKRLSK
jgi:hypothetical protein